MNDAAARDLFEQAADLPIGKRAAFLDRTCGDDAMMRQEVEALLAADTRAANETFWYRSALHNQIIADGIAKSAVGEVVGRYRLIELIGRGGMGAVYAAEHAGTELAIKLIDAKLAKPDFLARAPEEVVEEQRERRTEALARKVRIDEALARLSPA